MAKRVLLVDDSGAVGDVPGKMLTAKNFKIEIATTQAQAIDLLGQNNYDLCLIDIRAPGMSGMELYHYLKQEYPGLTVKVILTEGNASVTVAGRRFGKIRRPALTKPFTARQLRAVIAAAALQTDADTPFHNILNTRNKSRTRHRSLVRS